MLIENFARLLQNANTSYQTNNLNVNSFVIVKSPEKYWITSNQQQKIYGLIFLIDPP